MNEHSAPVLSVTALTNAIAESLETSFPLSILVEGELSNMRVYPSGHWYFTLKDADTQITAVLFQSAARACVFRPENGMQVIVAGRVSVYRKRGEYQLIASRMEPAGRGALQIAFEQLKNKLAAEGLFDAGRKRQLPLMPRSVGVVTSPAGAALHDIISVFRRTQAPVDILIYPVRVQGSDAASDIARAISYLNERHPSLDVLLVGRGGGSLEDLWAFNEELVARAIAASLIPVISCAGHETDTTIADFVSDLRAPTPTAAAEIVAACALKTSRGVAELFDRAGRSLWAIIDRCRARMTLLARSPLLRGPSALYEEPLRRIDDSHERLEDRMRRLLSARRDSCGFIAERLKLLSPLNVLSRGYAVCRVAGTKSALTDAAALHRGDAISVTLASGGLHAIVDTISPGRKERT